MWNFLNQAIMQPSNIRLLIRGFGTMGKLPWAPPQERIRQANMTQFIDFVNRKYSPAYSLIGRCTIGLPRICPTSGPQCGNSQTLSPFIGSCWMSNMSLKKCLEKCYHLSSRYEFHSGQNPNPIVCYCANLRPCHHRRRVTIE